MSNSLKAKVAVSSGAASVIPGGDERLGKDTCSGGTLIIAATRRAHALD
jgi:hypothetical protein